MGPEPGVWARFKAVHHGLPVVHKTLLPSRERTRNALLRTICEKYNVLPQSVIIIHILVCSQGAFY